MRYQWNVKTVLLVVCGGILILMCLFYPLNDLLATEVFETQGKCVEQRSNYAPGDMGTNGQLEYVFELAGGERVYLRKLALSKPVELGQMAVIYYRKGIFFGNKLYDRYEPAPDPELK